jgi:hypothetical protein
MKQRIFVAIILMEIGLYFAAPAIEADMLLVGEQSQELAGDGWSGLLKLELLGNFLFALVFATALGAVIAYHPQSHAKKETLEEVESPKTFLMYSVIGAVIGAMVVKYGSVIGFIVFGIGGLLRFRTNLGSSKQTGQLILVTLVGLCCGLNLPHVALLSTAFAYLLIYFLEKKDTYKIVIKNLKLEDTQICVQEAADLYRELLEKQGCHILSERKNFVKFQVAFVFRAPHSVGREDLEYLFMDKIPEAVMGSVDWQTS